MDSPGPTSIQFGAAGWRAAMARDFTFANVRLATQAVAEYLKTQQADPNSPVHGRAPVVIVGHDCRFLGPQFALAAAEVLTAAGLRPLLCDGATPAPVLALAIRKRHAVGGINIAAGHNPPEDSGFQFSCHDGAGAGPEVTGAVEGAIVRLQRENWSFPAAVIGTFQAGTFDPRPDYVKYIYKLVDFAAIRKARLKIAVDLMFGCGRGYLDTLLREACAKLTVLHNEPDAFFGGHAPDPGDENLAELRQAVRRGQAQLGLATSGDAGCCGVLDRDGAWLAPGQILALALYHLKKNRGPTRIFHISAGSCHTLNGRAALSRRPESGRSSSFALPNYEMSRRGACGVRTEAEKDGILASLLMAELVATERKSLGQILEGLKPEDCSGGL